MVIGTIDVAWTCTARRHWYIPVVDGMPNTPGTIRDSVRDTSPGTFWNLDICLLDLQRAVNGCWQEKVSSIDGAGHIGGSIDELPEPNEIL